MEFWAVIIACLSLAVSVWPKIWAYFRGVQIDIEVNNEVTLSQRLGHTNINWFISLVNSGGVDIRVKRIYLTITRNGIDTVIPGRNYFKSADSATATMLVPFSLKAGEEVGHIIGFCPLMNRNDERAFRSLEAQVRLETYGNESGENHPQKVLTPDTYEQVMSVYRNNYALIHGEYNVKVTVEVTTPKSGLFEKEQRFTLYESDEKDLRGLISGYITGDGISYFSGRQIWFNIPLVSAD